MIISKLIKKLFNPLFMLFALFSLLIEPDILVILFKLVFGWLYFLFFNLSKVEINIAFLIEMAICSIALFLILQHSIKLFNKNWQWQWTLIILSCPVLLFMIAISSIGLVQSYGFFMQQLINALSR